MSKILDVISQHYSTPPRGTKGTCNMCHRRFRAKKNMVVMSTAIQEDVAEVTILWNAAWPNERYPEHMVTFKKTVSKNKLLKKPLNSS